MARQPRLDFPGAWHHVMHRGARRAPIFKADEHCALFLETLGDAAHRAGLEVHAYALMPNHFHLLVRSPHGTLSRGMKHLVGVYSQRLNALHRWDGPLFRGRFRSQLVTRDEHLRHVLAYIHLNPVRAHLVSRPDEPCWTSYREHLGLDQAPEWLHRDAVRTWFGTTKAMAAWTRALHLGREPWPDTFDPDGDGWLPAADPVDAAAQVAQVAPAASGDRAPEVLLARAAAITDTTVDDLRVVRRGRGAGEARRFAVQMLLERGALSHAEVARALGVPVRSVTNLAYRFRHAAPSTRLAAWRSRWDAETENEKRSGSDPSPVPGP